MLNPKNEGGKEPQVTRNRLEPRRRSTGKNRLAAGFGLFSLMAILPAQCSATCPLWPAAAEEGSNMSNVFSARLRRLTQALAIPVFLLVIGTGSAQVTWPTLPPGFRAATNSVNVDLQEKLPNWARRALEEDNAEQLESDLRTRGTGASADAFRQRLFYHSIFSNAVHVAEFCLTNGASIGPHSAFTGWRVRFEIPLDLTVRQMNVPMTRLLLATGADPMRIQYRDTMTSAEAFFAYPSRFETAKQLEMAGTLVQGGFNIFATNRIPSAIKTVIDDGAWPLADTLLTNQPLHVLRSERGVVSLKVALEYGRTNAVSFLRSIPVPEK